MRKNGKIHRVRQAIDDNTMLGRKVWYLHVVCLRQKIQAHTFIIQSDTKKTGTFEKPNKNWRNPRKKFIDRNWIITTCLLRDSNPYYQCLEITSCRWRPPPRLHSFTATTHLKSSRSFVSPCVCCMLCRMRQSLLHSAEHATHTGWHKRTGTFEMRSGGERMHTWRRTPSTGRNFQSLII